MAKWRTLKDGRRVQVDGREAPAGGARGDSEYVHAPPVPRDFKQRAISVEEYPTGWTSYRQRDSKDFKRLRSYREDGRWVVFGPLLAGGWAVQTVRVRK